MGWGPRTHGSMTLPLANAQTCKSRQGKHYSPWQSGQSTHSGGEQDQTWAKNGRHWLTHCSRQSNHMQQPVVTSGGSPPIGLRTGHTGLLRHCECKSSRQATTLCAQCGRHGQCKRLSQQRQTGCFAANHCEVPCCLRPAAHPYRLIYKAPSDLHDAYQDTRLKGACPRARRARSLCARLCCGRQVGSTVLMFGACSKQNPCRFQDHLVAQP